MIGAMRGWSTLVLAILALLTACDAAPPTLDAAIPDAGDGGAGDGSVSGALGCGACAVACTTFVEDLGAPGLFLLQADATGVVWSAGLGPVSFFAAPPGGRPVIAVGSAPTTDGIAADDTQIYWLQPNRSGGDDLMQAPRIGGLARRLATTPSRDLPAVLTLDASALYFLDGRMPRTLEGLAKSGGAPYSVASGFGILAALSDGASVFYVDFAGGATRLLEVAASGGVPTVLATIGYTRVLRTDGTRLYWSDGALRAVGMAAGSAPVFIAPNVCGQLVVGGGRAYFLDDGCDAATRDAGASRAVRWVATGGPPVHTICSGNLEPLNLAYAAGALYVADGVTRSILRLVP